MSTGMERDGLIGEVLASRYRVEVRIGHGAMGTVYRARHVEVGRLFAIKLLHPRFLGDEWVGRRFAREAKLAGALHHPNVTGVVDVGETPDGQRYLVMEYADGRTLLDLIRVSGPLAGPRVISIVRQLCSGLSHAHELGLIHRDFKPENVIIERDRYGAETPRIVDFGISILRDEAVSSDPDRLTTAGLLLGTPRYMAPEHATGAPIDHRIDLFALGVTCFEMLTGCPPFEGDGVDVARASSVLETPVMSVRVPGLHVDPLLEAFTRKLMMKSRDARPVTARAAHELIDLIDRDRPAATAALGVTLADPEPSAAPPTARVVPPAPEPPSGDPPRAPRTHVWARGAASTLLGTPPASAATEPSAPVRARHARPPPSAPLLRELARSPAPPAPAPVTAASIAARYASVGRQLMALDLAHGSASTRELWPTYLQIHIKDVIGEPAKREAAHALLLRLEDQIARGSH